MFTRSSRYERVVRSQSCKKRKNCFKTLNTGMQRCRDHRCIYYRGGGEVSLSWPIQGGSARKDSFVRPEVCEEVGISLVEVCKRVISVCKKT